MNLFVGNISKSVNNNALCALFAEFGEVTSVKILTDRYTGESKGFAFVNMLYAGDAQEAMRRLKNAEFFGQKLLVSKARPKTAAL
jgi:RNA recognition motif-containing protein